MTFIVRMALREIRASWQRLLFFFICIAVGVAAIVIIRSVIQSVRAGLSREARTLTGADFVITSDRPFSETVLTAVARERQAGRVTDVVNAMELATMVRPADGRAVTKMVELKGVEPGFPLYGTLTLESGVYTHALLSGGGALVRPELLAQLNLHVGDRIFIGTRPFEIRGVIKEEPGRSVGTFSIGPRVLIDHADVESTGLLSFGSRASRRMLLLMTSTGIPEAERNLRASFANDFVRGRGFWSNADRMGQNLQRAENYLSLVGLVVLILGGIGVSSVTRVFVQQKVRSIAILKCVGSTTGRILAIYMTQVVLLGIAGSVLGVAIAGGVIAVLPRIVGDVSALLQADYGLTAAAVIQGLAIGLLVSLLFSLVPLLDIRHVKPGLLLRQDAPAGKRFDWLKWLVTAGVAAALVGVASWQAGSLTVGLVLSAGFVAVAVVLHVAGIVLVWAVQPLRYARSFALRHAVLHVGRRGNQTRVILLAVGLGAFFILGVRTLQANLLRDFSIQVGADAPDMFLIPVLRARVVGVEGQQLNLESFEQVRGRGGLAREFTVTYRPHLEGNEEIIAGRWWDAAPSAEPEVSIEEGFLERQRIQVGDRMRFDVLGKVITARVASIRRVQWEDFRAGGFMFVFRPGAFDGAPHTYISTVRGPQDAAERARMQAAVVSQFPNVSIIDLREILTTIRDVVDKVTIGVTVVGGLVLFSGTLILIGAVSMTKFRRVYEAAILKTLGASSRLIAATLLLEYGVLGTIAGTIGALGAIGLSWAIATFALELPWEAAPALTIGGIFATAGFVAAVGVLASVDVLRHKPLATLRAE
jgi:putative ABC transport system permease protein